MRRNVATAYKINTIKLHASDIEIYKNYNEKMTNHEVKRTTATHTHEIFIVVVVGIVYDSHSIFLIVTA